LDGRRIAIENAPTQFGPVSCRAMSKLSGGYVEVRVTPPPRPPRKMLLRAPLPADWRAESVAIDGRAARLVAGDAVELTGHTKSLTARFTVRKAERDSVQ
jgi:hypothetical protein